MRNTSFESRRHSKHDSRKNGSPQVRLPVLPLSHCVLLFVDVFGHPLSVVQAAVERPELVLLVEVEERLSLLEDQVSEVGSDQMLGELISSKTMLKKMHRTQIYHCDAINDWRESLLGERREHTGRSTAMDADQRHELNDLAEHFERVSSLSSL